MKFKIQDKSDIKRKKLRENLVYENDEYSESLSEMFDMENIFLDFLSEHLDVRDYFYSANPNDDRMEIIKEIDDYLINLFSQLKLAYKNCLKYIDGQVKFNN